MGAHHRAQGGKFKIWSPMGPHATPYGAHGKPMGHIGPMEPHGPLGRAGGKILNLGPHGPHMGSHEPHEAPYFEFSPPRAVVRTHYSDAPMSVCQ